MRESDTIDFKPLESYRGFLIYISRTYPAITPYLKGIHLTLDSWRPWRDEDAWKLPLSEIKIALALKDTNNMPTNELHDKPPLRVAPRLHDDILALVHLFSDKEPTKRTIQPKKCAEAMYMFGDASGSGFGSSLMIEQEIYYLHGQWSSTFASETSNYRELGNLLHAITEATNKGLLKNSELFVFTDNTTVESAFYKGTSSSKRLFQLVLDLRKLQLHGGFILHLIHVAGQRMIAQGDQLTRG
jgi:hypothetical protein